MYQQKKFLFFPKKPEVIDCEELFHDAHQRVSRDFAHLELPKNMAVLYRKYLEICWTYPFYGWVNNTEYCVCIIIVLNLSPIILNLN